MKATRLFATLLSFFLLFALLPFPVLAVVTLPSLEVDGESTAEPDKDAKEPTTEEADKKSEETAEEETGKDPEQPATQEPDKEPEETPDTETDGTEEDPPPATLPPPTKPLDFYFETFLGGNGYSVKSYFPGYTEDMTNVQTYYSLDGTEFLPLDEMNPWRYDPNSIIPNNNTLNQAQFPLREYCAGELDCFYLRLRYEQNDQVYWTTIHKQERPTESQPLPDDIPIQVIFPASMRGAGFSYQYNVTVREGMTSEEISKLLPDVLPVQLTVGGANYLLGSIRKNYSVRWTVPERIPADGVSIPAAAQLDPPDRLLLETPLAVYNLSTPPVPPMPLKLVMNAIPADAIFQPMLYVKYGVLQTDFPRKPSGATAILPSYSLDGGETWIETNDLLSREDNAAIDAFPKSPSYTYVTVFSRTEEPYASYLNGELDGFLLRFRIEGGVYDGLSETSVFPTDYQYEPPPKDNTGGIGSGGNENNAGSNNGVGDGSQNGGMHPGVADGDGEPVFGPDTTERPSQDPTAVIPKPAPQPTPGVIPEATLPQTPEPLPELLAPTIESTNPSPDKAPNRNVVQSEPPPSGHTTTQTPEHIPPLVEDTTIPPVETQTPQTLSTSSPPLPGSAPSMDIPPPSKSRNDLSFVVTVVVLLSSVGTAVILSGAVGAKWILAFKSFLFKAK